MRRAIAKKGQPAEIFLRNGFSPGRSQGENGEVWDRVVHALPRGWHLKRDGEAKSRTSAAASKWEPVRTFGALLPAMAPGRARLRSVVSCAS